MNNQALSIGIIDFNPKRMTDEEAKAHDIPDELRAQVGDFRQYPLNIASQFPGGVAWYQPSQPWFYQMVMSDQEKISQLQANDVLILSGAGMSAYDYQEGSTTLEPKVVADLRRSQEVIVNHLGSGKWVLGICFGGQLAMHAIGAKLGRLPIDQASGKVATEAGWLDQCLTDPGTANELAAILPKQFYAPHFHNNFVAQLPELGRIVQTKQGQIKVVKAEVLAVRYGYSVRNGLENQDTPYPQMSIVEFDNGAKLYQIQPHPEMATSSKANFLVRMNPWLANEQAMGKAYYERALGVPENADFSVAKVIPKFIGLAKNYYESSREVRFSAASEEDPKVFRYLLP